MNIIAVDWGKNTLKRSAYRAELATRAISRLEFDGSLAHLVEYASTLEPPVLIGIDAAIGFPRSAWPKLVGNEADPLLTFVDYLLHAQLPDHFFDPVQEPDEWSPRRPFIRPPPGPWSLTAFIEASNQGLYRQIDQLLKGNPIFVTSGIPGSVGSGTRALWQELIALDARSAFRVWPFHGSLDRLLQAGKLVIAEMYPKACYGIALAGSLPSPLLSLAKTRQSAREDGIRQLQQASWVATQNISIQNSEHAISNEDDFDALISAAALLRLFLEKAPRECLEPADLTVEGGVLGSASISPAERKIPRSRPSGPCGKLGYSQSAADEPT